MIESDVIKGSFAEKAARPSRKAKLQKIAVAEILFIACPGDDVAALSPVVARTEHATVDIEQVLGLYWANKYNFGADEEEQDFLWPQNPDSEKL